MKWPMYSKYLKCDECGDVLDRRASDDFGGRYQGTESQGVFAPSEVGQLIQYAQSLGWRTNGDKHVCPKHPV